MIPAERPRGGGARPHPHPAAEVPPARSRPGSSRSSATAAPPSTRQPEAERQPETTPPTSPDAPADRPSRTRPAVGVRCGLGPNRTHAPPDRCGLGPNAHRPERRSGARAPQLRAPGHVDARLMATPEGMTSRGRSRSVVRSGSRLPTRSATVSFLPENAGLDARRGVPPRPRRVAPACCPTGQSSRTSQPAASARVAAPAAARRPAPVFAAVRGDERRPRRAGSGRARGWSSRRQRYPPRCDGASRWTRAEEILLRAARDLSHLDLVDPGRLGAGARATSTAADVGGRCPAAGLGTRALAAAYAGSRPAIASRAARRSCASSTGHGGRRRAAGRPPRRGRAPDRHGPTCWSRHSRRPRVRRCRAPASQVSSGRTCAGSARCPARRTSVAGFTLDDLREPRRRGHARARSARSGGRIRPQRLRRWRRLVEHSTYSDVRASRRLLNRWRRAMGVDRLVMNPLIRPRNAAVWDQTRTIRAAARRGRGPGPAAA